MHDDKDNDGNKIKKTNIITGIILFYDTYNNNNNNKDDNDNRSMNNDDGDSNNKNNPLSPCVPNSKQQVINK